jgi:DNA replication protein DnaC
VKACAARKRIRFWSVAELMDQLILAQAAGLLPAKPADLARLDLLIRDELGSLALDQNRAHLSFRGVRRLYEQGSIVLTTNRRFETWAQLFAGDALIAGAILDRLLHHRHLIAINRCSDEYYGCRLSLG